MLMGVQLIAEGSTKLASVPSGGAGGGGAAPAAGGAAAGGAAAEEKEEEKEEGMLYKLESIHGPIADLIYREGRVRRGYGFRSLRLNGQYMSSWIRCSLCANTNGHGFWKGLCALSLSFAYHGSRGLGYTALPMKLSIMKLR
jgi:hypothetical protein